MDDNFEFIWLNGIKKVMYAGMYYNPLDVNSPNFSFSVPDANHLGKHYMILNA